MGGQDFRVSHSKAGGRDGYMRDAIWGSQKLLGDPVASGDVSGKKLLPPRSKRLLPVFSSRIWMASLCLGSVSILNLFLYVV